MILYDTSETASCHDVLEITTDLDRIREGIEVAGASVFMASQEQSDSSEEEKEEAPVESKAKDSEEELE